MKEKFIATIINQEGGPTFRLVLRGLKMAMVGNGWEAELPGGEFDVAPTKRELVELVYALYYSPEWEVADCIESDLQLWEPIL